MPTVSDPSSDPSEASAAIDPTDRALWRVLAVAGILGIFGAVAGLVFVGITDLGATWYGDSGVGWFEGHGWWVAVAVGAGLVVGLLRRALRVPEKTPGLIEDLETEHVDTRRVPATVAISAVSLIGGASLGPEVALGQMGGGAAEWAAKRRSFDDDDTKSLTLSGMAGAFGGLFSSPLVSMILVLEVARPPRHRWSRAFYGTLVASGMAFGLYFAIAGTVFLGLYDVPTYEFEDWHLLAGVAFGVLAAVLALVTFAATNAMTRLFARLPGPEVVKPAAGGLLFGLIGVALPLTNFTGSEQLGTVLDDVATLGVGLLVATLVGKMIAFAASFASGFIGGPIFPILFLGGISGVIVHAVLPDVPLGLAFSCLLAAVPGSVVAAPFSMLLLAALLTQIGALQTAPILIAVGTSYLTIQGLRTLIAARTTTSAAPH